MSQYIFTALILLSMNAKADRLVVIVDAKFLEDTQVISQALCDGDSCASWATYHLYQANVKKVFKGNPERKKIMLINSQHSAYVNKTMKDWLLVLETIENGELFEKYGAKYQVIESSQKAEMYCFDGGIEILIQQSTQSPENRHEECYTIEQIQETTR